MKRKYFLFSLLIFILSVIAGFNYYLYPSLRIASGYAAKYTCSYTFLSGFSYEKINKSFNFFPVDNIDCTIDVKNKSVTASLFGIAGRKAYYYQHGNICGCVLDSVDNINRILQTIPLQNEISVTANESLEFAPDSILQYVDIQKLNEILRITIDSNPATLAITVAYKNFLVAENYANEVNENTRLLGWSMTKTVMNALCGILEKNGDLNTKEKECFPEWKNDNRKEITLNNLLQMNSGLQWNEEYSMKTDVTHMLYLEPDIPAYALQKSLENKPGENWYYSSGTTNIISGIVRKKIKNHYQYLLFPFDSLFSRIGMNSATIEMDNAGNYICSSYGWASARDWTKFGLLYLNKGTWNNENVFTPQWTEYSIAPSPNSNNGYGAQIWLNGPDRKVASVPDDGYFANGYGGQKILVLPSKEMVVVILSGRQKDFDFNNFYKKVFGCFKK